MAPPFPLSPAAFAVHDGANEAWIATERISRWPMPMKPRPDLRLRFAVPLAGFIVVVVCALLLGRSEARLEAMALPIAQPVVGELIEDPFHVVTNVDQPPDAPRVVTPAPKHPLAAKHGKLRRAAKRPILALDTSTPLGSLRRTR